MNENAQPIIMCEIIVESTFPCSKRRKTDNLELDEYMKVLSNTDAWKLLVAKFGFHMTDDKYCLPGESQGFESIHEIRNVLCKYGIPGVGNSTTEEKDKV